MGHGEHGRPKGLSGTGCLPYRIHIRRRVSGGISGRAMVRRKFKIVLIKPSHYDNDGYVIQWWRSGIPSNSLASVHGLLKECAETKVLGADVDIDIEASDEC